MGLTCKRWEPRGLLQKRLHPTKGSANSKSRIPSILRNMVSDSEWRTSV